MPNFVTNKVVNLNLPFKFGDVEFIKIARGRKQNLVLTRVNDEEFFITIKPRGDNFLIKGEKITRPSKVGLLQKALEIFEYNYSQKTINSAFGYNKNSLLKNSEIIKSEKEILELINSEKFNKICIEIGFGSGRHILYRAKENKDTIYIGIEIYKPAIEQVAKLALTDKLENIYLIDSDARVLLSLIESNKIDIIYIHFPVPWEDAPHRRVISSEFLKDAQRILKKGGKLELRSDSREYVDYSILKFVDMNDVEILVFKNKNLEVSSKYEDRWKRQNKDIYDVFVTNKLISLELEDSYKMEFKSYNPIKIFENFENKTHKFNGYFVHPEDLYKFEDGGILVKFSFGAFDTPENGFIKISQDSTQYFIKQPLKTKKNFEAHKKFEELLDKWSK